MSSEGAWLGARVSVDPRPSPLSTSPQSSSLGEGASAVATAVAACSSGAAIESVPRTRRFQAVALDGKLGVARLGGQAERDRVRKGGAAGRVGQNGGGVRVKSGVGFNVDGSPGGVSVGVEGGGGAAAAALGGGVAAAGGSAQVRAWGFVMLLLAC